MQDKSVRNIVDRRRTKLPPRAPAPPAPSETAQSELVELGRKLQLMRQQRGYSLATASDAAGISPSFLSHVENGKGDITFLKLARLVEVYGASVHDLIPQSPATATSNRVVRGDALPALHDSENKAAMSLLAPDGHLAIRPIKALMRPDFVEFVEGVDAEQFMYVLQGMVEFEFVDDTYVLKRGDAIYVKPGDDYTIRVKGRTDAVVLNCSAEAS